MTTDNSDSKESVTLAPLEWQEPETGPGVSVNYGYDFGLAARLINRMRGKDASSSSGN